MPTVPALDEWIARKAAAFADPVKKAAAEAAHPPLPDDLPPGETMIPEQYRIRVTCHDGQQQAELLARWRGDGLECRALRA